jgi:Uma2 family endonuclease
MATVTESSSMLAAPPLVADNNTSDALSLDSLPVRRFTVAEYYAMTRAGILGRNEHVELIHGVIVKMAAKGGPHVTSVTNTGDTLRDKLGRTVLVRQESPIDLGDTEPEPDVVVARGRSRDYVQHHPRPADILLLIEVSEPSLEYDLTVKMPLYAAAGIIEYWVIDLEHSRLEVFRDVVPADADHPAAYRTHLTFFAADAVVPVSFPLVQIPVAELLP